ncbi:MAG TPA: type I methionyl aminopeptidase [Bacteroidia bacterium]|jgi:methionyl aminopeptidase|nr:type I methionyl aminopeptidase [Bacteroidia bacterium]
MIYLKTAEEIELMRHAALLVSKTLGLVGAEIKEGVTLKHLDKIAEEFIRDNKAVPVFKGYNGFPASLCLSMNEAVVHGIPDETVLKSGDIISVDCGVKKDSFIGDHAYTFCCGEIPSEVKQLIKITKECLYLGIEQAKVGNRIGDISFAVQQHAEKHGYGVVRELVGHGLGKNLHEKPEVPNYGKRGSGTKIQNGLTIAIEPMINLGKKEVTQLNDGWTIVTTDRKPSAHFEHDVAIVNGKADILSSFAYAEESMNKNDFLVKI